MKKFLVFVFLTILSSSNLVWAGENYTSLILDCRDTNLVRAMSPTMKDQDGNEIYPNEKYSGEVSVKDILHGGIFIYEKSMEDAYKNKKTGKKPLVIKAVEVEGLIRSNPVVSREDLVKIIFSNYENQFLNKRNVIIVH
jgi:hypothetical protein